MAINVWIQRVEGNGYRARSAFGHVAEGATVDEAMRLVREEMARQIQAGASVRTIEMLPVDHPWKEWAGDLKDDPIFDDWVKHMKEYRASIDNDPNAF
jgi:hypothetical protein